VDLSLPNEFSFLGGKAPSAEVALTGTNDSSPVLDHLDLSVPEANLGAVDLTDMRFRYERRGGIDGDTNPGTSCQRNEWKAQANIYLIGSSDGPDGGSAGFRMSPPPSQNGVGFCAGEFKNAGAQLVFGGPIPEPEVFPAVFLHQVNFAMQLNPTLIRGGAGLDVGKLVSVDGAFLAAFASPSQPYYLNVADAGNEFAVLAGRTFTATTIAVGGDVFMDVPGFGRIRMGSGAMMYSYPDYLYADGQVRIVGPGFSITGELGGDVDLGTRKFQFHGNVTGCLGGIDSEATCAGADGWVGSRGIAVCLNLGDLHPGAGIRFADQYIGFWPIDGCKPSRFWEENVHGARDRTAGAAANGLAVTLAKGETSKNIELVGAGAAPTVNVSSPDGRTLTITGDGFVSGSGLDGIRVPHEDRTFIGIKGSPGTYRIIPLAASASITHLLDTRKGYDSNFSARVVGRGAVRTLVYDARRPAGQLVTFAERGRNVFKILGTSHGGRARIRFTPAIGPGGRRQIVAIPTIDGVAIPDQTLASYVAPGIPKTGRPGRVLVRRDGTTLRISWSAARGATRYAVVLRLSDGSTRAIKLGQGRTSVRITQIPLYVSGAVQVSARGVLGNWASPRSASFRRQALRPTAQQTKTNNERLTFLKQHH
jgi:hypothetical protein